MVIGAWNEPLRDEVTDRVVPELRPTTTLREAGKPDPRRTTDVPGAPAAGLSVTWPSARAAAGASANSEMLAASGTRAMRVRIPSIRAPRLAPDEGSAQHGDRPGITNVAVCLVRPPLTADGRAAGSRRLRK
jgi:hypothetical protein